MVSKPASQLLKTYNRVTLAVHAASKKAAIMCQSLLALAEIPDIETSETHVPKRQE